MTQPPQPPLPTMIEVHGDPGQSGGVYANALSIWHTAHEFTLDFLVNSTPPQPAQTQEGQTVIRAPYQLVARVRIPPSVAFDVIRAVNENMTNFEQEFGNIRRPGQDDTPLYPPSDMGDTGN